jgi:phospholipid/cholesterol/gamma-HCH transport system substrate-binding protein
MSTKTSDAQRAWRNGLFTAAALTVFAIFVLTIGSKNQLLSRKSAFTTRVPSASGLKEGDSVMFLGVRVGVIERLEITGPDSVLLHYKVEASAAKQFTTASRATIGMLGVLGDKLIEITAGKGPRAPLEGDTEIPFDAIDPFSQFVPGAGDLVTDLQQLTARLGKLLEMLEKGQGTLPRLINDPVYGKQVLGDLQGDLHGMRELLNQLNSGQGTIGRLVRDPQFADRLLGHIEGTARNLDNLSQKLEHGPGALHTLSADADFDKELRALVHDLRTATASLGGRDGLLGRLLNDKAYGDELARHLASSAAHLDSILGKIDRGEGTIGGLVNDPAVYNDLKDMSAGLNHSFAGKVAVRHYQKKGHDLRPSAPAVSTSSVPASAPESAPAPASAPDPVSPPPK